MEPHLPNPNFTPERSQSKPEGSKFSPEVSLPTVESRPAQPLEQLKSGETKEIKKDDAKSAVPTTTLPVVTPPLPQDNMVVSSDDAQSPAAAADDDVIEKEWVNKAKKVVTATKGDPYLKEREVSKLQADYMKKRYGKEVKIPEDI